MKKAHFIGICGVGMSAVAHLLKEKGWEISGSDEGFYPPVSEYLKKTGVEMKTPYSPSNIPEDADLIVIGKNAKLIPESNEEVRAALESGKAVKSFPEVLGDLTKDTHNIVVAGSYGKSTTTALITHCLIHAGKDPSYFVGALPKDFETTSHVGDGRVFILEGDEYPSSNWDMRSKFLHYNATDVVLTSACHDHINVFPTLKDYHRPFIKLLQNLTKEGLLIACIDEENAKNFYDSFSGSKVSYGFSRDADFSASDITYGETTSFTLQRKCKSFAKIHTTLLGRHNVENILAAAAALLSRNLITPEEFVRAIANFKGIVRRLDRKSEKTAIPIYEGFGSSYEKAKAAIDAMKLHFPDKRLVVIFEPHTFTWRNKKALHYYDDIFESVDLTLVYEPASQGAETHEQLTQEDIVQRINKSGAPAEAIHSSEGGIEKLKSTLIGEEAILLLTSGDLGGLIEAVPLYLEEAYPYDQPIRQH